MKIAFILFLITGHACASGLFIPPPQADKTIVSEQEGSDSDEKKDKESQDEEKK